MGKNENRTFPIDEYLKDTDLKEPIKRMMRNLYKGKSKTMKEWANADEQINKRRC